MFPQTFFFLLPVIILVAGCYKKDGCCGHEPQDEDDKLNESNRSAIFLEINKTIESGNQFIDLENKNISDLTPLIALKRIDHFI